MEHLKKLTLGQKYTLVKMGDMGFPFKIQFELIEIKVEPYAQYAESVVLIIKEKWKRNLKGVRFLNRDDYLIYDGFVDPTTEIGVSKSESNGMIVTKSLASCDVEYLFIAMRSLPQPPLIKHIAEDSLQYSKSLKETKVLTSDNT